MHKQIWGFFLLLLYIMDSNRREYNLVCKIYKAILENIHGIFNSIFIHFDDLRPSFRKVGCDTNNFK